MGGVKQMVEGGRIERIGGAAKIAAFRDFACG
jgi:hypothetical protein